MIAISHPSHFGRTCDPAETVRRLQPHWRELGITRLARQTGLDRIGIPVWAAMRPNSRSLAVNQGKGIDDDAARASAIMEAAEYAIAERPDAPIHLATKADLIARGNRVFEPHRQMANGASIPDDRELQWLRGRQFIAGGPVWVPLEAARLDHTTQVFGGLVRSSNGLASGNNDDEAVLHGVCELIERDATTLLSLRSPRHILGSRLDPSSFESQTIHQLCGHLADADVHLDLFDLTTEIGVPVIHAVVRDTRVAPHRQFDLAAGSGCHPFAPHAAVRAITEAVQTRVTNISGARDDFDPRDYHESLRKALDVYLDASRSPAATMAPASIVGASATPTETIEAISMRLRRTGIVDLPIVFLGGARQDISVIKAFAPMLEDRPTNRFWRPGPRAANAMMRLW